MIVVVVAVDIWFLKRSWKHLKLSKFPEQNVCVPAASNLQLKGFTMGIEYEYKIVKRFRLRQQVERQNKKIWRLMNSMCHGLGKDNFSIGGKKTHFGRYLLISLFLMNLWVSCGSFFLIWSFPIPKSSVNSFYRGIGSCVTNTVAMKTTLISD